MKSHLEEFFYSKDETEEKTQGFFTLNKKFLIISLPDNSAFTPCYREEETS